MDNNQTYNYFSDARDRESAKSSQKGYKEYVGDSDDPELEARKMKQRLALMKRARKIETEEQPNDVQRQPRFLGKKIKLKNKKRFKSASAKKPGGQSAEPESALTVTLSSPETAGKEPQRGPHIKVFDEDGA